MRKIYALRAFLGMIAILFGMSSSVKAQNYYYVGTGTGSTSTSSWPAPSTLASPFGTYYEDNRTQYLIPASELSALGASGSILGLAFDVVTPNGVLNGLNVKIGHTTQTSITAYETGLTSVYSATHTPVTGWNNFAFNAPFPWDGVSNVVVEVCFDNNSWGSNTSVKYSTTTYNSVVGNYQDGVVGCNISTINTWQSTDVVSRPNIRFEFSPPMQNDAAITSLESPSFPACAMDSVVQVKLANYGTANLTAATINWSVNGTLLTPLSWTGNMVQFDDSVITVGTVVGGLTDADVLKVWSSDPNGVLDSNNVNDTIEHVLFNSLNGTYAINSAGTGDFLSLTEAAAAADAFGICGPTVFEIMDTLLTEQVAWDAYDGMNDTNTITITSASGVSAKVAYAATTSGDNYVFNFTGASNYIVEGLELVALGTSYGRVVAANGNSENVTINDCHLIGANTTNAWSNYFYVVYANGLGVNDWTITNNIIENGNYGIYVNGDWNTYASAIMVENNEVLNSYRTGVYVYNSNDSKVNNNYVTSSATYTSAYGVYVYNGTGNEIMNNFVEGQGNWPNYGLYIGNQNGDLSKFAPIHNNRVYMPGTGNGYGIYAYNGLFTEYVHNSVYYTGGSSAEGLYISNGQYNNFFNNIVTMGGAGTAVYLGSGTPVYQMDYNNFSAPSNGSLGYDGTYHADLASWTASTMYDSNSLSLTTVWTDTTTLKVCSDSLYGMGKAMANNMYDFEGDMRNNPPCIGADEFMPISMFGFSQEPVICDGDTLVLNQAYYDTVVWNSTDTSNMYVVTSPQTITVNVYDGCGTAADTFNVNSQDYAIVNDENLCEGTTATLTTGISNAVYSWSTGSMDSTVVVDSAQTISVEVVDANGCYSADTAVITQSFDASLPDSTEFCEGSSVTLDPMVPGTFAWNDGSTGATLSVGAPGNYCVTVTDQNCVSTACSDVAEILNPVASFLSSSSYQTVEFTNTSTNTDANTTYHWDFGDGTSSNLENPTHLYPWTAEDSITVMVTLTVSNDCGDFVYQDSTRYGAAVSVNEVEISNMINLYPNPSNGTFNVAIDAATSTDVNVEVLDVRGAMILTQNLGKVNGQMTSEINIEGAAAGIYFVKVNFNDQTAIYKLSVK